MCTYLHVHLYTRAYSVHTERQCPHLACEVVSHTPPSVPLSYLSFHPFFGHDHPSFAAISQSRWLKFSYQHYFKGLPSSPSPYSLQWAFRPGPRVIKAQGPSINLKAPMMYSSPSSSHGGLQISPTVLPPLNFSASQGLFRSLLTQAVQYSGHLVSQTTQASTRRTGNPLL